MSKLWRPVQLGRVFFTTHVTYNRLPILRGYEPLLIGCLKRAASNGLIDVIAWAILADHFHLIFEPVQIGLSRSMQRLKNSFSTLLRKQLGMKSGRIWQLRFWDHVIRDEIDLNRHIDYVHYNPVKHGLVSTPFDYPYTSLPEFTDNGIYERRWGESRILQFDGEYGE